MAFEEDEPPLERSYPYCTGWKGMGCISLFLGLAGAAGVVLVPACCEQWRNGKPAFGVLAVLGAPCTAMTVLFAAVALGLAVRDAVRPPLVRVTPAALLLPNDARGEPLEKDARGNPRYDGPRTHPAEIPFAAVRWVRREAGATPGNDRLVIVHDLGPVTLELKQDMMRATDFDELETVLRAAVPEAFVALPVPPPPPPPTDAD
jgi:hypothetical protein